MTEPWVEFGSEFAWQQIYDQQFDVQYVGTDSYHQINLFELGVLLTTPFVAALATSTKAKSWWWYAGTLYQRIQLGAGGATSGLPVVDSLSARLALNRPRLLKLPVYDLPYQLVFDPPYWLEHIRFTLWEYTGPVTDAILRAVESTNIDLIRIEEKLD
jgi:hypothetical protein